MSGAFQLLRSNDLVWSAAVHEYLMDERQPMIDLMAWNADTTRMPYRMHSEYLRRFFLANDLAAGRYEAGRKAVSLRDIHAPVFAVSTITDHVAPWRSVYKIQMLTLIRRPQCISTASHGATSWERIARGASSPAPCSCGEYQGERHTVTVVANGYVWRETTYASHSTIARAITGTAWSGPRFFGLRAGANRSKDIEHELAGSQARTPDADRLHRHGGRVSTLHAKAQR
jgi:hypothetical protein